MTLVTLNWPIDLPNSCSCWSAELKGLNGNQSRHPSRSCDATFGNYQTGKKKLGSLNQWLLIVHDHLAGMSDRTRLNRSAFDGETMRCRPTDWWCSKVIRCLPLSALRADVEPLQPWYHSIRTANQAVQGQYFGAGLATYLVRMKSDSVEAALWRCTRGVRSGACQPVQLGSRHWPLQLEWMNSLGTSSEFWITWQDLCWWPAINCPGSLISQSLFRALYNCKYTYKHSTYWRYKICERMGGNLVQENCA